MAERGGPLVLAQPTAVASARLSSKLYMPTALIKAQLPAGLGDLQTVPRLSDQAGETHAARLQQYIMAIRATAKVFATYKAVQGAAGWRES